MSFSAKMVGAGDSSGSSEDSRFSSDCWDRLALVSLKPIFPDFLRLVFSGFCMTIFAEETAVYIL